jgi:hypothetical protein
MYKKHMEFVSSDPKHFAIKEMFIEDDSKQRLYKEGAKNLGIHIGQLKLFYTELTFFLFFWDKIEYKFPIILYIGAGGAGNGGGKHIVKLAKMFPTFTFYLYDTGKFNINEDNMEETQRSPEDYRSIENDFTLTEDEESNGDRIFMRRRYFEKKDIEEFKLLQESRGVYLISDIRTTEDPDPKATPTNDDVLRDMKMQEEWVIEIEPIHSLLKFRTQFNDNTDRNEDLAFESLDGHIMKQLFAGRNSTEMRLIPRKGPDNKYVKRVYSSLWLERIAAQINYERSTSVYINPTLEKGHIIAETLYNDFDSTAATYLVEKYLIKMKLDEIKEKLLNTKNTEKIVILESKISNIKTIIQNKKTIDINDTEMVKSLIEDSKSRYGFSGAIFAEIFEEIESYCFKGGKGAGQIKTLRKSEFKSTKK